MAGDRARADRGPLIAAGSLPVFFPPAVKVGGDTIIDSVMLGAANSSRRAIERGFADEIWVIWTTSRRGVWKETVAGRSFFGLFEEAAQRSFLRTPRRHPDLVGRASRLAAPSITSR